MHILPGIVCGLLAFGLSPFLQWIASRTPTHQSLTRPAHHCTNCGTHTTSPQQISLIAVMVGKRHCGNCNNELWPSFPGFEIFTAVCLTVVGLTIGWTWTLPAYFVFFMALVVISAIDLKHYMIPNRVLYPSLYATFVLILLAAVVDSRWEDFKFALIGMAAAWLFFFVVWFIYPRGMGFGDVRLSALVGLMCGWVGLGNVVMAVLLSLFIGAGVGVILIVLRLRNRKQAIPFGPFLAAGAAISILWGQSLAG